MMTKLLEQIQICQNDEYARAAEQHGRSFHSLHEAYAVTLEEIEEASEDMDAIKQQAARLWDATREDNTYEAERVVNMMIRTAAHMAAEAVQVSAMAMKTLYTMTGEQPAEPQLNHHKTGRRTQSD